MKSFHTCSRGSIRTDVVGRRVGGSSVNRSYRFCLPLISLLSPYHPAFLLPLPWCQLTQNEGCGGCQVQGYQDIPHRSLWMVWPQPYPPKKDLATLFSLHKPSMALASGRSQSQRGAQCCLHFACCLLLLLCCVQLPLSACCSLNISWTLQLCFSVAPCLRVSLNTYTHILVALFIALSSGDQCPSSQGGSLQPSANPTLPRHPFLSCKRHPSFEILLHDHEGP